MRKKYITKTQLGKLLYRTQQTLMNEYGLTKKWIDLLGEPEMLIRNNYGGDPVKLFYLGKVYDLIENNIEDYIKRIEKWKKLQEKRHLSREEKELERIRQEEELKKQYEIMWEKWKELHSGDEDLALVKAVWFMNKFIKMRLVDKSFYMVKDVWVNYPRLKVVGL